jgi:hypothetical protein
MNYDFFHERPASDREALAAYMTATANFLDSALAALDQADAAAGAAARQMQAAGAMLRASTTASQAGLWHVALDLVPPVGEPLRLLDLDLTASRPPRPLQ